MVKNLNDISKNALKMIFVFSPDIYGTIKRETFFYLLNHLLFVDVNS